MNTFFDFKNTERHKSYASLLTVVLLLGAIFLTLSTALQKQTLSQHAQTSGNQTVSMLVTFYGWPDNDPPSANIALPGLHQSAGGTGTFDDPVTFATDPNEYPAGTKVYVPFLKKYGVMEDTCAQCITDWSNGQNHHIDIWMTSDANSGNNVIQCEEQWTKDATSVEINPPSGREVYAGNIFDPQTKTCLQSLPSIPVTTQPPLPQPSAITPTLFCLGSCPSTAPNPSIASTAPSTNPSNPPTSQTPISGSQGSTAPSIDPCSNGSTSALNNGKEHRKWRRGGGGGFFEQLFKFLLQFIEELLKRLGLGGTTPPPDPGTGITPTPSIPSPCISPTTAANPLPSVNPTISVAPSTGPTTSVSEIKLGAAIEPDQLDNTQFTNTLKTYKFNSLTPENAMKFGPLEPTQGQFNWAGADKIVNYAQANNMRVRGHNLVWHVEVPAWVAGLNNAQASAALENHIKTVVGRYKGKIAQWDVVNEALNDDGTLRDTVWKQKLGDDYIAQAFTWAHEADPNAELFYNDYGVEGIADRGGNKKAKSDAVYAMVKDFKARGIPISGVGLQTHSSGDYPGTGAEIGANIKRLTALGVKVEITELDVVNVSDQAARYAEIGTACKQNGCSGVTTWGLYDGHTWLTGQNPLMFDTSFQPKPAYTSLMQSLGL